MSFVLLFQLFVATPAIFSGHHFSIFVAVLEMSVKDDEINTLSGFHAGSGLLTFMHVCFVIYTSSLYCVGVHAFDSSLVYTIHLI